MPCMKRLALAVFLLCGCASDGFVDGSVIPCGPGQTVTVEVGLDSPTGRLETVERGMNLLVLVANNGHEEIRVTYIRAQPVSDSGGEHGLAITGANGRFDQPIAGGDEHTFEMPTTVRMTGVRRGVTSEIVLDVSVGLSSGDVYRCRFLVPV